jgi:hypothetical protein
LEDANVLDVVDDLEYPELEEVLEDDEAVLDRDDEGCGECLGIRGPREEV